MSNERPWETLKTVETNKNDDVDTDGLSLRVNEHFRSSAVRPKADTPAEAAERKDPILDIRSQPTTVAEPRISLDPLASSKDNSPKEAKRIKPILGSLEATTAATDNDAEPTLERHNSNADAEDREPTIDSKPITPAAPTQSDEAKNAEAGKPTKQKAGRNWPLRIGVYLLICVISALVAWWAIGAFEGGISQLAEDLAVPTETEEALLPEAEATAPEQ